MTYGDDFDDEKFERALMADDEPVARRAPTTTTLTIDPSEPVYVRREMPWSQTIELGREGIEAYVVDIPTREDFDHEDDPITVVFVPIEP